jgi:hypothetical protein
MEKVIIKAFKIGAITGFWLAAIYTLISLIVFEFYLPNYEPSILVVFKQDSYFLNILTPMFVWGILLSSAIGGATSVFFRVILEIFHWQKQIYILTCTFLSMVPSGLFIFAVIQLLLSGSYGTSHLLMLISDLHDVGPVLLLFPSIIYLITSTFISCHLYNQFSQNHNVISPAS